MKSCDHALLRIVLGTIVFGLVGSPSVTAGQADLILLEPSLRYFERTVLPQVMAGFLGGGGFSKRVESYMERSPNGDAPGERITVLLNWAPGRMKSRHRLAPAACRGRPDRGSGQYIHVYNVERGDS